MQVEFIDELNWTNPESVPREIQKFDIGVLPHRSEGEWNKNKTSLKDLEYMACGVPVLCSLFGEMSYVINDGINGYLADNEEEFAGKLKKLLSDKSLREKLGYAGQKTVQENYCYDSMIPSMIELIRSLS